MPPLLTTIVFLPLVGALAALLLPAAREGLVRRIALGVNMAVLALVVALVAGFDRSTAAMQFVEQRVWIPAFDIRYVLGVDGLSLVLVVLTALLGVLACLASGNIRHRVRTYFFVYQVLMTGMLGTFLAQDMVLFYIFFEAVLVPMFFLIGIWGGSRRDYAAWKFFFYTLAGSLLMLVALVALYLSVTPRTFSMLELTSAAHDLPLGRQIVFFLVFFFAFAVKIPAVPFHTWLPDAHVEAPTPVSVLLAGVLLKMGTYGLLRICVPFFPDAAQSLAWMVAVLGMVNIIYGAGAALAQTDLKKMIAYSSVSHMGFVLLGVAAMNSTGFNGAILEMFNHGIITGAMFLLVGVIYERAHTRDIAAFGGLSSSMPRFAFFFAFMSLASLGLPGLGGFVGEFLSLAGSYAVFPVITIAAAVGVIVLVVLFLEMVRRVLWGAPAPANRWPDMSVSEMLLLVPLVMITLAVGLYPEAVLGAHRMTVNILVNLL